jgi:O-methyltransferase domain
MADSTRLVSLAVADAYDFTSLHTVVDVGGGNGALLIGILKANPGLHGTVFDQPDVAERARRQIAASGLAARCQAVGGDFFNEVPHGADAYLFKYIIIDWSDDLALTILRNCRSAMAANSKLLIVEGIYPAHVDQSDECRGAATNDVNMLIDTGGRLRSRAEFHSLLEKAALELTRVVSMQSKAALVVSLIEAVPRLV